MNAPELVPIVAPAGVTISAPTSRLATPAMLPRQPQPWSSNIFACYQYLGNCCWTMFCPAVTFGTMANAMDNQPADPSSGRVGHVWEAMEDGSNASCCSYFVRQWCCASATISSRFRARIREKYNLVESPCSDFATHCCLPPCALCQEYRELKRFNLDLGRKKKPPGSNKKSLRHQLLFKSVTRALNESTVATDGSVVWLTTHPGGPTVKPEAGPSTSSGLRPTTS